MHQHVLDLLGGREVGEAGLHAHAHLPDDRLWGHMLPRPLPRQQLVPDCPKCVNITSPETKKKLHMGF